DAALGAAAGVLDFSGVVGDLGGGSMELFRASASDQTGGESFETGVIRLQDDSEGSPERAAAIVRERLAGSELIQAVPGGAFIAVGGTWRSLAKLHQVVRGYPLHMVQHYVVPAKDMIRFCADLVAAPGLKGYKHADAVSTSRRELVPFGAAVLAEALKAGNFGTVAFSALGVREGYLYGMLDPREQAIDPLMQGAEELSVLRSRSPAHVHDLVAFTTQFFAATGLAESAAEKRLRVVSCLISDISWRVHPDYRGAQSVDSVAYGSLSGIDHPGRAFLAQVMAVRYDGLKNKVVMPLAELGSPEITARARLVGALFRVAYPMTAAMPGILARTRFEVADNRLMLMLPADLAFLDGEHLRGRLEQMAGVAGFKLSAVRVV
ncbi:exopolyphosphatase, partial [Devosia sp.]|uniref:Ppx/GppA phosphatase family protein n=1 Tax=Devosia sp. TaxID=1871048 RepID=UPI002AFF836E